MKLIKINTILKQAFSFMALYWVADMQLGLSPIGSVTNEHLIQGIFSPTANTFSTFIKAMFGITREDTGSAIILGTTALYGLLWGIFYERHQEDYSLVMTSKTWVMILFAYSGLLSADAIVAFSKYTFTTISALQSVSHVIFALYLLPALAIKGAMLLSPLFIAIQSGKSLLRKLYNEAEISINI